MPAVDVVVCRHVSRCSRVSEGRLRISRWTSCGASKCSNTPFASNGACFAVSHYIRSLTYPVDPLLRVMSRRRVATSASEPNPNPPVHNLQCHACLRLYITYSFHRSRSRLQLETALPAISSPETRVSTQRYKPSPRRTISKGRGAEPQRRQQWEFSTKRGCATVSSSIYGRIR